ncbi:MAG: aldehyde dehydrogenase family protein [Rhodocyclaceae bacterium]|nr:aldehyde dehydrogenase family protein [Rhodocyclaceae bacterium]
MTEAREAGNTLAEEVGTFLGRLGVPLGSEGAWVLRTPIDDSVIASVDPAGEAEVDAAVGRAADAAGRWREVPAPRRGELVHRLATVLRREKAPLARLVSIECGKILPEAEGEVQEMIDICDFAVGLSRQLYGRTMPSERPGHRMMETWHPIGVCGVITAFNFPVAVWAWNAAIALVCGNAVVWKPSEKTPLTALACHALLIEAAQALDEVPQGLAAVLVGDAFIGRKLADDARVALVSATGSTRMGQELAPRVARRFGRCLLELGGNNAMIVTPSADLELASRAIVFAAVGTAGQRCTSLRRLIVHEAVREALLARVEAAYATIRIGNPLEPGVLLGPLIDARAFAQQQTALAAARDERWPVRGGARVRVVGLEGGHYVRPAIVECSEQNRLVSRETFAPVLFVLGYRALDEAIRLNNAVPQGLSSSIFTSDLAEAERFLSSAGSDCGIANVNIGPSGAEIGGAFGGEKETGGGREAGSDAWKAYMRRATNTINYSGQLPLAQGVQFE